MRALAKKIEKFNQIDEENIHSMGQKVPDVSGAQYDAVMDKPTKPSGVKLIIRPRVLAAIIISKQIPTIILMLAI